jgi:cytochrome c-type biogenesis protein CcmH
VRGLLGRLLGIAGIAAATFLIVPPALAVQPDEVLADAGLEARARALSRELRCMVCQNQSIDDSDAPLARDLRLLVRERIKAGDNDQQILDFLVARYGQFVLLRPRFEWETAILWFTPLAVFLIGLAVSVAAWRARRSGVEGTPESTPRLTPAEERQLAEIITSADGKPKK